MSDKYHSCLVRMNSKRKKARKMGLVHHSALNGLGLKVSKTSDVLFHKINSDYKVLYPFYSKHQFSFFARLIQNNYIPSLERINSSKGMHYIMLQFTLHLVPNYHAEKKVDYLNEKKRIPI